jgi:hypothetical protein
MRVIKWKPRSQVYGSAITSMIYCYLEPKEEKEKGEGGEGRADMSNKGRVDKGAKVGGMGW